MRAGSKDSQSTRSTPSACITRTSTDARRPNSASSASGWKSGTIQRLASRSITSAVSRGYSELTVPSATPSRIAGST